MGVLFGIYRMGIGGKEKVSEMMDRVANAITVTAMLLVMMGGGGRFKEVVMDGGVGDRICEVLEGREM